MQVFLVWHASHAPFVDGSPTEHVDETGELIIDADDGADLKLLGVYASEVDAQARIDLARTEPGFSQRPLH